mmetsp:Transcript_28212/g.61586  ORF Transcript_28212/g.61586 Transcript_28212/m.61586 type:complete len:403 (-) Transcript_28212:107-1315(-)
MEELDAFPISSEKKKYILESVNPILEDMVVEVIQRVPGDPVPFMLEWLEKRRVQEEDKQLSPEERTRLETDNARLEEEKTRVKMQMREVAKYVAEHAAANNDQEEDDDDEEDEAPPDFFDKPRNLKARQSVSAEAYGEWNTKKMFVPAVVSKTEEQTQRLRQCLRQSILFSSLDERDMWHVIGAMKEVTVAEKTRVINQGDDGDFLFVVEKGELDCIILGDEGETVVKTCKAGDIFGELALLYNCPRQASVVANSKCILWQLDRDTFSHIVKEAAQKKLRRHDAFLAKVSILSYMTDAERSQLADALHVEDFPEGHTIVNQGEIGLKFYILEEGTAEATKDGTTVMQYGPGDYFGELALIKDQPRAATIRSTTPVKLLSLNGASFKRLLNFKELLDRASTYI